MRAFSPLMMDLIAGTVGQAIAWAGEASACFTALPLLITHKDEIDG